MKKIRQKYCFLIYFLLFAAFLAFYFRDKSIVLSNEELEKWEQKKSPSGIDCQRVLMGDLNYTAEMAKRRVVYFDPALDSELPMDCSAIQKRQNILPGLAPSKAQKFPIAFVRLVYKDYRFLEGEFAANFDPQNFYCFAIDGNADSLFIRRIRALAKCFPNIIIPAKMYPMDSRGKNILRSVFECIGELMGKEWNYLITLNNHDVQVRTNEEMVQIFRWMGGGSDIELEVDWFGTKEWTKYIAELEEKFKDWTFQSLGLFKNESLNAQMNAEGRPKRLKLAKGYFQGSFARHFVEFIHRNLNLNEFLTRLDKVIYAPDELFFQTLASSDDLNAPGGFTRKCIDQRIEVPFVTRHSIWWTERNSRCYSGKFRHSVCLLGIEDLIHNVRDSHYLFVNKMWPQWDFGAIFCWHQEMRRRALEKPGLLDRLSPKFYKNRPQMRFYEEWKKNGEMVDRKAFGCGNG